MRTQHGLKPIAVRTGLTDGVVTEVHGDGVHEELEVVVAENQPDGQPHWKHRKHEPVYAPDAPGRPQESINSD